MIPIGKYLHPKTNGIYWVTGFSLHTETEQTMVEYRNSNGERFVRPLTMFTEEVSGRPRFELLEKGALPENRMSNAFDSALQGFETYYDLDRFQEALEQIEEAIKENPYPIFRPYLSRVRIHVIRMIQYEKAMTGRRGFALLKPAPKRPAPLPGVSYDA